MTTKPRQDAKVRRWSKLLSPIRAAAHTPDLIATLQPLGEDTEIIIVGQTGTGKNRAAEIRDDSEIQTERKASASPDDFAARLGRIEKQRRAARTDFFQARTKGKVREGVRFGVRSGLFAFHRRRAMIFHQPAFRLAVRR